MSTNHAEARNRFAASPSTEFRSSCCSGKSYSVAMPELAEAGKAMMTIDDPASEQLQQLPGVQRFEMMNLSLRLCEPVE